MSGDTNREEPTTTQRSHLLGVYCHAGEIELTDAAKEFFLESHDAIHFVATPYMLADKMDQTLKILFDVIPNFNWDESKFVDYSQKMKNYDQVGFDMLVARIIDLYMCYISELLTSILSKNKKMLKSSKTIKFDEIIDHDDINSLIGVIVEKVILDLSFKGFKELSDTVQKDYGLSLISDDDELQKMTDANEFRNLFVHNRGIVNRLYLNRVPTSSLNIGDRVHAKNGDFVPLIAEMVLKLDNRARDKFSLEISNKTLDNSRCFDVGIKGDNS